VTSRRALGVIGRDGESQRMIRMINLPKMRDPRGNLSFIQENSEFPFTIKRVYWIYDVPGGEIRGSHAFRKTDELIVALSGSFNVVLHDGITERNYFLNRSYHGLLVPRMIWRKLDNFSTNSLALMLASTGFDTGDYIRNFDTFLQELKDAR